MNSRPLVILGLIIILIAVIAAVGYGMHGHSSSYLTDSNLATTTDNLGVPTTTATTFYDSTTTPTKLPMGIGTSTLANLPIPGQVVPAIDTSAWFLSVDNKIGYSIEYPSDLVTGKNGDALTLVFPKNNYFHWPLLDDVKVTVSVTPHSCPPLANITGGPHQAKPVEFILNGYKFVRNIGTDVGAGQLYTEIVYDTLTNGFCYRVDLLDHGTNGSGFYVDDTALIRKYDAQHDVDMTALIKVFNTMVGTLRVLAQTY